MITKCILFLLGLPKTIIFNFYYFPFIDAIKFPVFVSHRVWLKRLSGNLHLDEIKPGIVKIGFGDVGIFDQRNSNTIWHVSGDVIFHGKANVNHGVKFSVSGILEMGEKFTITAESTIVAKEKISIGKNVLLSWDCLIMDTDFHKIYDFDSKYINEPSQVIIGNNVWIGCRSLILKGVKIEDGTIVAAASTVTKSITQSNIVLGGNPNRILKENIRWDV